MKKMRRDDRPALTKYGAFSRTPTSRPIVAGDALGRFSALLELFRISGFEIRISPSDDRFRLALGWVRVERTQSGLQGGQGGIAVAREFLG
jgi:hypothetical protein